MSLSLLLKAWIILASFSAFTLGQDLYPGFGYPSGVEVWCGKAYLPHNESFSPGGWLHPPPVSSEPLLDFRVRPRMSLYLANEDGASFIFDTRISYQVGQPLTGSKSHSNGNSVHSSTTLSVKATVGETGLELLSDATVPLNVTGNEVSFDLKGLTPRFEPYQITISACSSDGSQSYIATTEFSYLHCPDDNGSVVKLDNLYGGLWILNTTNDRWSLIFPVSFYVSWYTFPGKSISRLDHFKAKGYNIIHFVPNEGLHDESFRWEEFDKYLDRCDELGLYVMYDMRYTYQNTSSVHRQVEKLKSHPSLLLWYTGDEPDGATDPLNATSIAYSQIRSLDPYHPISLCLFCYNFHYQSYASGGDIILEDVYPIADNTSYSHVYGTVCNTTYGCCGCDDCNGNFIDISTRLDRLAEYDIWLGSDWQPKTRWAVPQAIGNNTFWSRIPTEAEMAVMVMLSINHNAKGIVAWDYPTAPSLERVVSELAKIITKADVTKMLLGANALPLIVSGQRKVDAAAWMVGKKMLVSIVNLKYEDSSGESLKVDLPENAGRILESVWGSNKWSVNENILSKDRLSGLEVDLLILDAADKT